jgi:multiple sugar transport system permease protein
VEGVMGHIKRKSQARVIIFFSMGILIVYLGLFSYFPMVYSFIGSFMNWQPIKRINTFTGFDNYRYMFQDPLYWLSLRNTLVFAVVSCTLYVVLGLVFASLTFSVKRGRGVFRTSFFMPVITSGVAVSILWKYAVYNTDNGILNTLLGFFKLPPQMWLLNERQVIPSIIAMTLWKELGYAIIIFYAGLSDIPKELFEAATIDGAGGLRSFRSITIPLVKPAAILVAVTGMINFLQILNPILLMTGKAGGTGVGGPGTASYTMMLLVYQRAFKDFNFGRASVAGYTLTLVILIFSAVQLRLSREEPSV